MLILELIVIMHVQRMESTIIGTPTSYLNSLNASSNSMTLIGYAADGFQFTIICLFNGQ